MTPEVLLSRLVFVLLLGVALVAFLATWLHRKEGGRTALVFLGVVLGVFASMIGLYLIKTSRQTDGVAAVQGEATEGPATYAEYFGETCKAHDMTIVDAGAHWCHFCRMMTNETFANSAVKAAIAHDGFVNVYEEESPEVIKALEVDGYPTIIFLDRQCREVHRTNGFREPEDFMGEVKVARGKLPAQ